MGAAHATNLKEDKLLPVRLFHGLPQPPSQGRRPAPTPRRWASMVVEMVELPVDDKGEGGVGGARRRGKGKVQRQWKPPSDFIAGRRGRRAAGAGPVLRSPGRARAASSGFAINAGAGAQAQAAPVRDDIDGHACRKRQRSFRLNQRWVAARRARRYKGRTHGPVRACPGRRIGAPNLVRR